MGWFWSDGPSSAPPSRGPPSRGPPRWRDGTSSPSKSCPINHRRRPSSTPTNNMPASSSSSSACPIKHGSSSPTTSPPSTPHKINPLNNMYASLPQNASSSQPQSLPTAREASSIPKATGAETWEYPSPQQMYHALLRKGYADTDVSAVEAMVGVHNFLNEGAWGEIVEWERRFAGGLRKGWARCRRGEGGFEGVVREDGVEEEVGGVSPTLVRFEGRPGEMTPKAAMVQALGKLVPSVFGTDPPFDRHDWYVSRGSSDDVRRQEVRYVIDYYAGPPEPTGEPVFYLDVRPAMTVTGACERALRWGCDTWWKACGGDVREQAKLEEQRRTRMGS